MEPVEFGVAEDVDVVVDVVAQDEGCTDGEPWPRHSGDAWPICTNPT